MQKIENTAKDRKYYKRSKVVQMIEFSAKDQKLCQEIENSEKTENSAKHRKFGKISKIL